MLRNNGSLWKLIEVENEKVIIPSMSLETVELIMTIEEELNILIPDAECEQISTVQNLVDCVYEKVKMHSTEKNISQMISQKIREAMLLFVQKEMNVTLETSLGDLLGDLKLRNHWAQMEGEIGLKIPSLIDLDRVLKNGIRIFGMYVFEKKKTWCGFDLAKTD